jgi:Predicted membrane protein (DUF2339)
LLLPWGLAFGLLFAVGALSEQLSERYLPGAYFALAASVAIGLELLSAALDYDEGRWPPLLLFAVTPLLVVRFLDPGADPLAHGWPLAWLLLFGSMLLSAVRWLPKAPKWLEHSVVLLVWSASLLFSVIAFQLCEKAELSEAWGHAAFTNVQAAVLLGIVAARDAKVWPMTRHRAVVLGPGALGLLLLTLGALVVQVSSAGEPAPLPFIALLNPLDLSHVLGLLAVTVYVVRAYPSVRGEMARIWPLATAVVGFIAFNGMLARAVHHQTGVSYAFDALWETPSMHWVLSGAWTAVSVGLIFLSSKRGWRNVWIAAASLLALTVFKLFVVDLSRQSTIAKIVTFLAVGVALLVVGFVSPLPPKPRDANDAVPPPPEPPPPEPRPTVPAPPPDESTPATTQTQEGKV